jgi:hypothetical protein
MDDLATLRAERLRRWRQTPDTRITGPDEAVPLIERAGVVTLFPASPEVPNLFHAFMGDPNAKTEAEWDSPSGQIYTWRWVLGRREAAFYGVLVHGRPTWIAWDMLPAVLRVCGDQRMPDELYDTGVLSQDAYRIAHALDEAGGVLSTGELRKAAGFEKGREARQAYLKAVAELDARLLLGKTFASEASGGSGEEAMSHALVPTRYRAQAEAADRLTRDQALELLLMRYLPQAVYIVPTVFARHMKLPEAEVVAACERLATAEQARPSSLDGVKGVVYVSVSPTDG